MIERFLDVALTAREVGCRDLDGVGVVAVDILRASTTITAALGAGALGVWPVADPDRARCLGRRLGGLVGGEREGLPLPGFDLGNSPREYTREVVGGRPIILTTSNGTLTLVNARAAGWVVVGCFNNLGAVASWVQRRSGGPVLIACAGTDGGERVSGEDLLFAGELVNLLTGRDRRRWHLREGALAAGEGARNCRGPVKQAVAEMPHARRLVRLGLGDDIAWAGEVDSSDTVGMMLEDSAGRPYVRATGDGSRG
ncbi:MAG: 2-phosphosulfolactate phosphatase [Bacillota bacterium]